MNMLPLFGASFFLRYLVSIILLLRFVYMYMKAGLHVLTSEVDTREALLSPAPIEVGTGHLTRETSSLLQDAAPHTPPRSEPASHLSHPRLLEQQESPLHPELPQPFPSPDQVRSSDSQEEPAVSSSGKPKKSLAANIQVLFLSSSIILAINIH